MIQSCPQLTSGVSAFDLAKVARKALVSLSLSRKALRTPGYLWFKNLKQLKPQQVVDNLDPTENGEAGEETHCASDQAKLGLRCHLELELGRPSKTT